MSKVGNFTKQTLKNGAKVIGGHRVKFVSDDKEFIILLTSYGYYYGLFLTYESDGAHIDPERTPKQSQEHCFSSLEECEKYWKVGEFAETKEEEQSPENVRMQTAFGIKDEKKVEPYKGEIKAYKNGAFYEIWDEEADAAAKVLGLTVIQGKDHRSVGFPIKDQYRMMAKLVRAGYKMKVIEAENDMVDEKPKAEKPKVEKSKAEKKPKAEKKEQPEVEVIKLKVFAPVESKGMEAMREQFVKMCDEQKIDIDKTCIKQSKEDPSHGTLVGYKEKVAVVEITWHRKEEGKEKKYFIA